MKSLKGSLSLCIYIHISVQYGYGYMSHKSKSIYFSQVTRRKAHYRVHITCIKNRGRGRNYLSTVEKFPFWCLVINKSPSGLSMEIVLVVNKSSWRIETAELARECQQMKIKHQRQQSLGFAIHLYLRKGKKKKISKLLLNYALWKCR